MHASLPDEGRSKAAGGIFRISHESEQGTGAGKWGFSRGIALTRVESVGIIKT